MLRTRCRALTQSGVIEAPRVKLRHGLIRTKEKSTSVPAATQHTQQFHARRVGPAGGQLRPTSCMGKLSILQAEFSLTQVLDQPVTGRIFFEEVIRENLDIGRPSQVSLVFDRKVNRRTPGPFRTRVITDGVVPSLHVDYKKTRIKQYHKEGQAAGESGEGTNAESNSVAAPAVGCFGLA